MEVGGARGEAKYNYQCMLILCVHVIRIFKKFVHCKPLMYMYMYKYVLHVHVQVHVYVHACTCTCVEHIIIIIVLYVHVPAAVVACCPIQHWALLDRQQKREEGE